MTEKTKPLTTPTLATYSVLQDAYDYFNEHIFEGKLPECLITLSDSSKRAYGYFRHRPFSSESGDTLDEIALNPFTFQSRDDRAVFSTLVHEMVHLWQHHFGKPKKTHHDTEWASKMESIGLVPSSTGAPGGKRTGGRVSHYINEEGLFARVVKDLDLVLEWRGGYPRIVEGEGEGNTKTPSTVRHTCPLCEATARAKPTVSLICGDCSEPMESDAPQDDRVVASVEPNPKKPGSQAHFRYEFWKVGATVEECLRAGLAREDVRWDVEKGFVTLK